MTSSVSPERVSNQCKTANVPRRSKRFEAYKALRIMDVVWCSGVSG